MEGLSREDQDAIEALRGSLVRAILAGDAINPLSQRSWIFPRDPNFTEKAGRVLNKEA